MLCRSCRRQVAKDASFCATCGAPVRASAMPLEVVLPDGSRVPLSGTLAIGRAPGNELRISDQTVSRHHARIVGGDGAPYVEDAGSSHGTYVDGRRVTRRERLRDGARVHVGNVEFRVERRREEAEAGRTIVVRPGASLVVSAVGETKLDTNATTFGFRPRVRSGWALKKLAAGEGAQRYVLKDLRGGGFVRMGDAEAAIFERLNGQASLPELITEAEQRFGPGGAARLARLLADLGERGFLEGVEEGKTDGAGGGLAAALKPREFPIRGLGRFFDRLYLSGGFVLFTAPALAVLTALGVAGLAAFFLLIARRYGTPFVVADKIGFGGLAFLLGRFLVVAFHETAHGLAVASFGRRVTRAGLKLMLVFPFAFVDASDAWFEPRRRRLAISAAGPASDLVIGGVFALVALALGAGTMRDIFFQLALAAYVGAFSNLNPLLDRDGYHMLVDWLGEPGLRRRAREHFAQVLAGRRRAGEEARALTIYGAGAVAWSLAAIAFVVVLSTRYYGALTALAPAPVVWAILALFYLLMFVPVAVMLGRPLAQRWRGRNADSQGASP